MLQLIRPTQDYIIVSNEETPTMHANKRITPEAGGFAAYVNDQRIGWRASETGARELASEAAYDIEHDRAPQIEATLIVMADALPDADDRYEPFGTLSDGTPIVATIDPTMYAGQRRSGLVETTFNGWHLFAQDDPDLFTIHGNGFTLENLTRDQIATMRALFTSDIPEQLLSSAVAYGRGDTEPPTFAPQAAPPMRLDCLYYDPAKRNDLTDQPVGPIAYATYSIGDGDEKAEVSFKVGGEYEIAQVCMFNFLEGADLAQAEIAVRNLLALLALPEVRAARAADTERYKIARTADAKRRKAA